MEGERRNSVRGEKKGRESKRIREKRGKNEAAASVLDILRRGLSMSAGIARTWFFHVEREREREMGE